MKSITPTLDAYSTYRDSWGLCHPTPYDISHNGIRFTAEMVIALKNVGELSDTERDRIFESLKRCQVVEGLLSRHPERHRSLQNSIDDYVAWGSLAKELKHEILAIWVVRYARRNDWIMNNVTIGEMNWSAFLGRFPQLEAHMCFAANLEAPLFNKLWWIASVLLAAFTTRKKNQDGWVLSWFLVKTARDVPSGIIQRVRQLWVWRFKKIWPGGIGPVLGSYFNDQSHPSAQALANEFGE